MSDNQMPTLPGPRSVSPSLEDRLAEVHVRPSIEGHSNGMNSATYSLPLRMRGEKRTLDDFRSGQMPFQHRSSGAVEPSRPIIRATAQLHQVIREHDNNPREQSYPSQLSYPHSSGNRIDSVQPLPPFSKLLESVINNAELPTYPHAPSWSNPSDSTSPTVRRSSQLQSDQAESKLPQSAHRTRQETSPYDRHQSDMIPPIRSFTNLDPFQEPPHHLRSNDDEKTLSEHHSYHHDLPESPGYETSRPSTALAEYSPKETRNISSSGPSSFSEGNHSRPTGHTGSGYFSQGLQEHRTSYPSSSGPSPYESIPQERTPSYAVPSPYASTSSPSRTTYQQAYPPPPERASFDFAPQTSIAYPHNIPSAMQNPSYSNVLTVARPTDAYSQHPPHHYSHQSHQMQICSRPPPPMRPIYGHFPAPPGYGYGTVAHVGPAGTVAIPPQGVPRQYELAYTMSQQQSVEPYQKKRRGNLPKQATNAMKEWFSLHVDCPYPDEEQKQQMCRDTGLNMNQVSNWFINARRRMPEQEAKEARRKAQEDKLGIRGPIPGGPGKSWMPRKGDRQKKDGGEDGDAGGAGASGASSAGEIGSDSTTKMIEN